MTGGHKAIFSLGENSNNSNSSSSSPPLPGQIPSRATFHGKTSADSSSLNGSSTTRHSILGKRPSLRSSATATENARSGGDQQVNRSTSGLNLPKLRLNTGSASTANLTSSPHEGLEGHHFSSSKLAKLFKPHHNQRRTPVEAGQPLEGRLLDSTTTTKRAPKPTTPGRTTNNNHTFESSNGLHSSSPSSVSRTDTVASTSSPPQTEVPRRLPSASPSPSNHKMPLLSACPIVSNAAPSMSRNSRAYSLPRSGLRPSSFNSGGLNLPSGAGVGSKNQVLSSKAFLPPGFEPPTQMLTHKYQEISYLPQASQKIGEGATAVVRQMQSIDTHRICAVKEFRKKSPTESDESYYSQLASEYMLAKSLHHANIVSTYDLVLTPVQHQWCHVMEFCDGGDVFSLIQQLGPTNIGPSERNCLFKQLLLGVEFIHRSGIAHRDIKPENLLLTSDRILKISDFGVSDLICEHPTEFDAPIKLCRDLCGSEPYTAPEIFATKKYKLAYDGRLSDVWSCAIVYFCLSFGGNPFKKAVVNEDKKYANFVSRMEKYCRDHPEDCKQDGGGPLFQNDNLPFMAGFSLFSRPALRLIYRMMQPDPSKRCTSFEAITDSWLSEVELCCKDPEKPPKQPDFGERRVPLPGYGPEYLPLEVYQQRLTEENDGIPVSVIPRPVSLTDLRAVGSPASPYFLPMKRDDGHPNHAFVDGPGRPMSPQSGESSTTSANHPGGNSIPHVKSGLIAGVMSRPNNNTDRPVYNRTPSSGSSSYLDITRNEDGKEDKSSSGKGGDKDKSGSDNGKETLEESLASLSLSRVPEHDEDVLSGGETRSERSASFKSMLFDDGHNQQNGNGDVPPGSSSSHQETLSRARGNSMLTPSSTSSSNSTTDAGAGAPSAGSNGAAAPPPSNLQRARSPSSLSMSSVVSRSRSPLMSNPSNGDVPRRSTRSSSTSLSRKPKHDHVPPLFKKKSTFFIGTL